MLGRSVPFSNVKPFWNSAFCLLALSIYLLVGLCQLICSDLLFSIHQRLSLVPVHFFSRCDAMSCYNCLEKFPVFLTTTNNNVLRLSVPPHLSLFEWWRTVSVPFMALSCHSRCQFNLTCESQWINDFFLLFFIFWNDIQEWMTMLNDWLHPRTGGHKMAHSRPTRNNPSPSSLHLPITYRLFKIELKIIAVAHDRKVC